MKLTSILTTVIILFCTGCQGAPQYAGTKSKADNELSLGWGRSLRLGAETDATMDGFKTANGTQIDKLVLKQSPAATMANGWVPAMDAYGRQQVNFVPILKQYGDNAVGITNAVFPGVSEVMQSAAPMFAQYMAGKNLQTQAAANKQQIIGELLGGAITGKFDPTAYATQLPPEWAAELVAKLNALNGKLPTSQPAGN